MSASTKVWTCKRVAVAFVLLLDVIVVHAAEEKSIAGRIAENFLEELLGEGGIKKASEGLGYAGSERLGVERTTDQAARRFSTMLAARSRLTLVPPSLIAANSVYRDLVRRQGGGIELVRALARDIIGRASRARPGGIDASRVSTIAIVTHAAFNGGRGLTFANRGVELVALTVSDAAALAQSLGADYLITITLSPYIREYEPMSAEPGTVTVLYHARVIDRIGQTVFDEKIPRDEPLAPPPLRFVGYQLSFFEGLRMNLSKALFLFPTEAQTERLTEIEAAQLEEVFFDLHDKLAQRIMLPRMGSVHNPGP